MTKRHRRLATYPVEFVVEAAGVANRISVGVSPPQSRRIRVAVGARGPGSSRRRLKGKTNERPSEN